MVEEFERRLAAILSADVVGYSRLMAANETGTLFRLNQLRRDFVDPTLAKHRGRIVKLMGDGTLVEFQSVVDAVACAAALQRGMAQRNAEVPEAERIFFRIGINLGDIIVEGDDIHGDGVNISARLEQLAEPGGIIVSANAYDQVVNKVDAGFEDLGPQQVKNIPKPVGAYRVVLEPVAAKALAGEANAASPKGRRWMIAAAALVIGAVVGALFALEPWAPRIDAVDPAKVAFELPDKPSIAVLPFDNLSDDPEQEWFADGMTDDLMTDLSKISGLFVIARNTAFTYKGKAVDMMQVGRELGVRYLLEGSIRRAGDQVRINAQLIDASTGGQVWADRFDEPLRNIFALQDRVTERVISAMSVTLTTGEKRRLAQMETASPEAYEAFLRGWQHIRRYTPEDFAAARDFLEAAIALDPNYGRANAALALVHYRAFELGWARALGMGWNVARMQAGRYLREAWGNPTSLAHQVASEIYLRARRTDDALAQAQRALALDPNDPENHVAVARALIYSGRAAEAVNHIERAMRLDTQYPAEYLYVLGLALFGMERFDEAVSRFSAAVARNPSNHQSKALLAASYAYLNRPGEAERNIQDYLANEKAVSTKGQWSAENLRRRWPYLHDADWKRLSDGLVAARGQAFDALTETPEGPLWGESGTDDRG